MRRLFLCSFFRLDIIIASFLRPFDSTLFSLVVSSCHPAAELWMVKNCSTVGLPWALERATRCSWFLHYRDHVTQYQISKTFALFSECDAAAKKTNTARLSVAFGLKFATKAHWNQTEKRDAGKFEIVKLISPICSLSSQQSLITMMIRAMRRHAIVVVGPVNQAPRVVINFIGSQDRSNYGYFIGSAGNTAADCWVFFFT